MTDEQLASILAGQTAMIATICELLIEKQLIDRTELCNRLYELLRIRIEADADPKSDAGIKHLIRVLETEEENR